MASHYEQQRDSWLEEHIDRAGWLTVLRKQLGLVSMMVPMQPKVVAIKVS